ncbi:PA0069 family radical SAM protein [Fodinicurvata sp. EGI_FJ10296]|uniref:PA0069 family radical SAM protein n=1 Tax=Fodinicurvata sp. EGI_FJ10296 TaxID=3231908 RepID=UPI0034571CBB
MTKTMDGPNGYSRHTVKARGAVANVSHRYTVLDSTAFDDGWDRTSWDDDAPPPLQTHVGIDHAKSIISRNQSPDVPFDRSVNPYRGCEHGCVYCFARPSHAYLDLSPGLDFETRLFQKPDAARLLRAELGKKGYTPSTIAIGANTDPYQPIERRLELTRGCLAVLSDCRHPVSVITKSALVERDIDLLCELARDDLATVCLSITTLDRSLARIMEPRAATPARRIETVRRLSAAGIPVFVLVSPIIPFINDHEIEAIVREASAAGAVGANALLVRLPHEVAPIMEAWLRQHFPDRADRVLNTLRGARGGRLNDPRFGSRMRGEGPMAEMIMARFRKARDKSGLGTRRWELRTDLFTPPGSQSQLSLF